MNKEFKSSPQKLALLALAGVALLTPSIHAQSYTNANNGDLMLGFRATANPGVANNVVVDLGPVSSFYNAQPNQVIGLGARLSATDLSANYGAGWASRNNLYWGAAAGFSNSGPDANGKPAGTLWITRKFGIAAPNRASFSTQSPPNSTIIGLYTGFLGSFDASPLTGNGILAVLEDSSATGSWTKQDTKTIGTSFGYYNPIADGVVSNEDTLVLYELQPGSGAGTTLGDLVLANNGNLTFTKAGPATATCKQNVTLTADPLSCTATALVSDIDGGSSGYHATFSLSAYGPFSVGTTNITLTAIDILGGTNQCTTLVTIAANAPTLAAHADVSNSVASCTAPTVNYTAPVASGCTAGSVSCSPASGTTFQFGTTPVTCVVTNTSDSQAASSSFNVVVTSTAAPTLAAHADVSNSVANCTAPTVNYTAPVASGCNTPGAVVCTPASGTTFQLGTTSVSCTVSDAANRTASSSFNVVVTSTAAPTLNNTPSNISTSVASASATSLVVTYTAPTASGCNTPGAVTCAPASGYAFPVGSTNVVCTVTDAANRSATSSFTVTVSGQGINGIKSIVSGITTNSDPKMNAARINSLLSSLTIAANDLNKYKTNAHTHVITTNVTAACAQLNAELIKARVYFQIHLLSTNTYASLTNAVSAQQKALGCK